MTFRLTPEEATTEGPYTLGPARPLTSLEIAYTQMLVEAALYDVMVEPLGATQEPARPSPLGKQASQITSIAEAHVGLPGMSTGLQ